MKNKTKKNKRYWVDTFAGCIVSKKDTYAPPERYFEARKSSADIYTDTFEIDGSYRIDFSWYEAQRDYWNELVHAHFKRKGIVDYQTAKLIKRAYPPRIFDKLLEE